jgi:hypothetical protein
MVLFERDSLHQKKIMFLGGFSRKDTEETTLLYTSSGADRRLGPPGPWP